MPISVAICFRVRGSWPSKPEAHAEDAGFAFVDGVQQPADGGELVSLDHGLAGAAAAMVGEHLGEAHDLTLLVDRRLGWAAKRP